MKKLIIPLILFIFGAILYTLTIRGIYGNPRGSMIKNNLDQLAQPFELSPERGRYILTMSLAELHSFGFNQEMADAADPDVGYFNGKFFIFFAPGMSMLAYPLYLIGQKYNLAQVASFSIVSIFATMNLIMIYLIAKNVFKVPAPLAFFAAWVFGFASTSWSYAITLYQHHTTTFIILSIFYAVWRMNTTNKWRWLSSLYIWIAYAVSIWIDYPNAVLVLPVMVYFALSAIRIHVNAKEMKIDLRPAAFVTFLAFVVLIGLHGYYSYVNFGSPTKLSSSIPGVKHLKVDGKINIQQSQKELEKESQNKKVAYFFNERDIVRGFSILTFADDKGIFIFSPILLLGVLGIFMYLKKPSLTGGILIASLFVNIFLYSSWGDPWGGWAYGPRYLIPSMAFLSIFVGYWLGNTRWYILGRLLAFVLFLASAVIALTGVLTTNQVPPKVEAVYLKMKYGFLLDWNHLQSGISGSFIYNTFAVQKFSLMEYFLIIYCFVVIIGMISLLILTRQKRV